MKLKHESNTVESTATMNDLPSEVMKNIFKFVGRGNYCFIAPVSKDFCYNYLTMDVIEDSRNHKLDHILAIQKNLVTTVEAAYSYKDLAEYCFLNAPEGFQQDLLAKAAVNGRRDIVTMGHALGVDLICSIYGSDHVPNIAKRGDLEMLKLMHEKEPLILFIHQRNIVHEAAFHGHLDILKWLESLGNKPLMTFEDPILFERAAKGGHLDIIQWGKDVAGYTLQRELHINHAAEGGHLELVQWFRGENAALHPSTLCKAAQSGNIALTKYLLQSGCPRTDDMTTLTACYSANTLQKNHEIGLKMLKFLHQNGVPWNANTCMAAARTGNLDALKYARSNGCAWDQFSLFESVQEGHFEIVEYCLQNSCPLRRDLCSLATINSNCVQALQMLKLLRRYSIPWGDLTCAYAAKNGNLEALKWVRNEGCTWDECTFMYAIHSKDRTVIQYCFDNDCPFTVEDYGCAVDCGSDSISILNLIRENGYGFNEMLCSVAARAGKLNVLRWLRYKGCPWNEYVCSEAVCGNHYDVLVYAHQNGCPLTADTYAFCFSEDGINYYGTKIPTEHECSDEIFEYLQEHDCPRPHPSDWENVHSDDDSESNE